MYLPIPDTIIFKIDMTILLIYYFNSNKLVFLVYFLSDSVSHKILAHKFNNQKFCVLCLNKLSHNFISIAIYLGLF